MTSREEIFLFSNNLHRNLRIHSLTIVGHCDCNKDCGRTRRMPGGYFLFLVMRGAITYMTGGRMHRLEAGQIGWFDTPLYRNSVVEKGTEFYFLVFSPCPTNAEYYKQLYASHHDKTCIPKDFEEAHSAFEALLSPFRQGKQPNAVEAHREITRILTQYLVATDEDARFRAVFDYIEQHMDEELSVKKLADISGLSSYYFIHSFRVQTGQTPHEYLVEQRVRRAAFLLASTQMTLGEIAKTCGFANTSTFNNTFKKYMGKTPNAYLHELARCAGLNRPEDIAPPEKGLSMTR